VHALDQTQSVPEGHCRKSQTATVTPAKPGDYPFHFLALGGGVRTLALLALLFVGAFFRIEHLYGAGVLFGIATCLVAASLVIFATDVRLDLARYVPNRQNKAGT
jgi:hypothetical protein